MDRDVSSVYDLTEDIAKHAFKNHINEFRDKTLGPVVDIQTQENFRQHAQQTLESYQTKCFQVEQGFEKGARYFYNEQSNTMIVVPGDKNLEPTMYRPDTHEKKFEEKIEKTSRQQGYEPEIKRGIYELIPELSEQQTREQQEGRQEKFDFDHKAEKGIRVVCDTTGKIFNGVTKALDSLLDFFVGAPPARKISPSEYARSAEARKEYHLQQGRAAKRNEALDQMAEQIRQEKSISLSQLKALSAQDIVSLRDQGDAGLMTLISRREEEPG